MWVEVGELLYVKRLPLMLKGPFIALFPVIPATPEE